MSDTAELLLGVIAVAVAILALVQVGAVLAGLRMARRLEQVATDLETGVKPLMANLTTLTAEAARTAALAAQQVERFDRVSGDLALRLENTLASAQKVAAGPAREGMAIIAGLRATLTAIHELREAARRRTAVRSAAFEEEEESLFIG